MEPTLTFIQSVPLFSQLSSDQQTKLASVATMKVYQPQENIVKEHDPVDRIFILTKGKARVLKDGEVLAILHPNDTIGLSETGFFSQTGLRTATVEAVTEVEALQILVADLSEMDKIEVQLL